MIFFLQIQPISQKFNMCVADRRTDQRMDGPTGGRTDTSSYRYAGTKSKGKDTKKEQILFNNLLLCEKKGRAMEYGR